ncbi:MAG TPA: type II secretion system F family protein [Bacillota bacterium]|nr:type II secretion system F family protein [Bacillota bacterium]
MPESRIGVIKITIVYFLIILSGFLAAAAVLAESSSQDRVGKGVVSSKGDIGVTGVTGGKGGKGGKGAKGSSGGLQARSDPGSFMGRRFLKTHFPEKIRWLEQRKGLLEDKLSSTGLHVSYWEYQLFRGGAIICGGLVGLNVKNWGIAIIGALIGYNLPSKLLNHLREKRRALLSRQLEPALQQIATLYKINNSLEATFEQALSSIQPPLSEEFEQLLSDVRVAGMSLDEALMRLANRLELPDFTYFARIALISQQYGGETRELIAQIPQTIRDRQLMRAELETELASAKQQAWLLLAATPVFFMVYRLMRPDFVKILTDSSVGRTGMLIVAGLSLISVLLIDKISEPVT